MQHKHILLAESKQRSHCVQEELSYDTKNSTQQTSKAKRSLNARFRLQAAEATKFANKKSQ